jgi:DNA repair exonuclease SbcCD ATPase subunit
MSLSSLKSQKSGKEQERRRIEQENATCRQKINEIQQIYNRMKGLKEDLIRQKREVRKIGDERQAAWRGRVWQNGCRNKVVLDIADVRYTTVINEVDANLDALNDAQTAYENRILENVPIIGRLSAQINSLWNQIVNWVN